MSDDAAHTDVDSHQPLSRIVARPKGGRTAQKNADTRSSCSRPAADTKASERNLPLKSLRPTRRTPTKSGRAHKQVASHVVDSPAATTKRNGRAPSRRETQMSTSPAVPPPKSNGGAQPQVAAHSSRSPSVAPPIGPAQGEHENHVPISRPGGRAQCVTDAPVSTSPSATKRGNRRAHPRDDTHPSFSPAVSSPQSRGAQCSRVIQENDSPAAPPFVDQQAQHRTDSQRSISPLIDEIRSAWNMRQRWLSAKNRLVLQAKAFCRGYTKGDKAEATKLFDRAFKKNDFVDDSLRVVLTPFFDSIRQFDQPLSKDDANTLTISVLERRLDKMVRQLPYHAWVKSISGFGEGNLAAIVGEAGDIATYRNPSCLWKRMGLAVINGERQRKCADKDLAIIHGYNPRRRAVAFILGDTLVKGNKGEYRALYDEQKARQLALGKTKNHAHKMAMRYMVKRVLKDLWIEATGRRNLSLDTNNLPRGPLPQTNGGAGALVASDAQLSCSPRAAKHKPRKGSRKALLRSNTGPRIPAEAAE